MTGHPLTAFRITDPYSRLRVPRYQKAFEILFMASFLGLYYAVLIERDPSKISAAEVFLGIWIAAFACEEYGDLTDAGVLLYSTDFWSLWDLAIVLVGCAYLIARKFNKETALASITKFGIRAVGSCYLESCGG